MTRISPYLWSSVAAFLVAAPPALADPATDAVSVQAMPGGVADPAGATGFVSNAYRNIVAVDLSNGKEKWWGPRGDYPAAVVGHTVLALNADPDNANVLRLSVHDTETGKTVLRSDPVAFPAWVDLRPGGQTFGFVPRVEGGALWLRWRAQAGKKDAAGAARIDLKSGKVDMLGADKMPPPPPALPLPAALTKLAQRDYETPAGPETNVLTAGKFAAAVDVEKNGAGRKVILRRWDAATGTEQDPITLAEGGRFQVRLFSSAGMVAVGPAPDAQRRDAGRWRVFSLETGKLRGSVPVLPGMVDTAVIGGRFYFSYVGPPPADLARNGATPATRVAMLFAVDLDTGQPAWRIPLDPENPFWSFLYGTTPPGCDDSGQ